MLLLATRSSLRYAMLALAVLQMLIMAPPASPVRAEEQPLPYTATATAAGTTVGGGITTDTVWTRDNSPYTINFDVVVARGATLTIEPGVEVRVAQVRGLQVHGTIIARGSADARITFTGASATPGWWNGIVLDGDAPATALTGSSFEYVTIEYGGRGYGNLYLRYATVSVSNSTLRHSSKDGVYGSSGGVAHISDTTFTGNAGYAIQYTDGRVNPDLAALSITGNGSDAIALGLGRLTGAHRWENVGAPYYVLSNQEVAPGATLTVDPGVTVRFDKVRALVVNGALRAEGEADAPIIFTAATPTPGWWRGIHVEGQPANPAAATLSYVTVEYGGYSGLGNIYVDDAVARIEQSLIRHSLNDGVFISAGGEGTVIERSQIVQNARFGINNTEGRATMVAAHNWWGDASGPRYQGKAGTADCNPGGAGNAVTRQVAFKPFLTAAGQDPGPVAPADVGLLSLSPRRLFVPADGVTRAAIMITLRDGAGQPLAGRQIKLASTWGTVVDGGPTNFLGQAFAYLTAAAPGEARITALAADDDCSDLTRPVTTMVTFTPFDNGSLMPDAEAPYANTAIEIAKEPILPGEPNTLRGRLTNPNSFPIAVNATFGYAQFGIGQTFGPIGEARDIVIEANSTGVVEVPWTPQISGAYCLELQYAWRPLNGLAGPQAMQLISRSRRNINVRPAPPVTPRQMNSLEQARYWTGNIDSTLDAISFLDSPSQFIGLLIPDKLADALLDWNFDNAATISEQLSGGRAFDPTAYDESPPRLKEYQPLAPQAAAQQPTLPSFREYAQRVAYPWTPVQPGAGLSAARAQAANTLARTTLDLRSDLRVTAIATRRYLRAVQARDVTWSSRQLAAMLFHRRNAAQGLQRWGVDIKEMVRIMRAEGVQEVVITPAQWQQYQDDLRANGFDSTSLAVARSLGMTDAQIEQSRQRRLALPALERPVGILASLEAVADRYYALGVAFDKPDEFWGFSGVQGLQQAAAGEPSSLIQAAEQQVELVVGNPLAETATVDLRVRPVDLPADWLVSVAPITATLRPGQQITATVTIAPGRADVQGTQPRVAVEGYAGAELIGGAVIDVFLPRREVYDPTHRVYLPILKR